MTTHCKYRLALGGLLLLQAISASAQTTAFSYQGRLLTGGNPANGAYDLKLFLYDAPTNGNVLAGPVTNAAVAVSNGLFTTLIDFGPGTFTGPDTWLHIGARTNDSGAFTALSPRQQLTPVPNAFFCHHGQQFVGHAAGRPVVGHAFHCPVERHVRRRCQLQQRRQ